MRNLTDHIVEGDSANHQVKITVLEEDLMLVPFNERFVPFVRDGSKQHTIRARRADGVTISAGDRLDMYGNTRQASMYLIARHVCTRVQAIELRWEMVPNRQQWALVIAIDGVFLSEDEAISLAWRDGFRATGPEEAPMPNPLEQMGDFWIVQNDFVPGNPPFQGNLIHWDHSKRLPDELPKEKRGKRA